MGKQILPLGLVSQTDVAEALGMNVSTFSNWIVRGLLPAPTQPYGRRKYYSDKDVVKLRKLLEGVTGNRVTKLRKILNENKKEPACP